MMMMMMMKKKKMMMMMMMMKMMKKKKKKMMIMMMKMNNTMLKNMILAPTSFCSCFLFHVFQICLGDQLDTSSLSRYLRRDACRTTDLVMEIGHLPV